MIKSLGVTADEYKKFNKHVMRLASKGYDVEEIDIYEYVIQSRAKKQFSEAKIPRNNYPLMNMNTEETAEDAAWNQIRELKKTVAKALQNQVVSHLKKAQNEKLYDLDDYEEIDPRTKFLPTVVTGEFRQENPDQILAKINKVAKVMRQIAPEIMEEPDPNIKVILDGVGDGRNPPNSWGS